MFNTRQHIDGSDLTTDRQVLQVSNILPFADDNICNDVCI